MLNSVFSDLEVKAASKKENGLEVKEKKKRPRYPKLVRRATRTSVTRLRPERVATLKESGAASGSTRAPRDTSGPLSRKSAHVRVLEDYNDDAYL